MGSVNVNSYEQWAFVQDWLAAWTLRNLSDGDREHDDFEGVIEQIQETQPPKTGEPVSFTAELEQERRVFLQEIDGMIESTGEFIGDDNLSLETDTDGRFLDLAALNHVREMYGVWYDIEDGGRLNEASETGDLIVLSRQQLALVLSSLGVVVMDSADVYGHETRQDAAVLADKLDRQFRLAEEARHAQERQS